MPDTHDLDELIARLPRKTAAAEYEEIQAARRAALTAPPPEQTIIPMPVTPHPWPHPWSGIFLFPCALRCGWAHSEDTGTWTPGPIVFCPDEPGSFERALTERAAADAAAERDRIEAALREHFATVHPGVEIPTRGVS